MTKRREFSAAVKKTVIKRATVNGLIICEECKGFARRFQIDHIIADAHGGEPVLENAQLLCEGCYSVKNPKDTTIAAKLKRVENRHIGASRPSSSLARKEREPKRLSAEKQCNGMPAWARRFVSEGT